MNEELRSGPPPQSQYLKIDEAYARANDLFAKNEIKLARFRGIPGYTDAGIRRDAEEADRLKSIFEQSLNPSKKLADILEAVIYEHGDGSNWLGGLESKVIKTSRFDDYKKSIDMVVETREEAADKEGGAPKYSHLALGIDVTFSGDLQAKFSGIRANIDNGRLGQVRYFLSDRPDPNHPDRESMEFAGSLNNIPQVVVGVEVERAKELGLLWMNHKTQELSRHPAQRLILREIVMQLTASANYARHTGKGDLAVIIEKQIQKIEKLMREKREAGIQTIEHDKVFDEIKLNLSIFDIPN